MEEDGNQLPNTYQLMFWKVVPFYVTYHVPTIKSAHAARAWHWIPGTNNNQLFTSISKQNSCLPFRELRLKNLQQNI